MRADATTPASPVSDSNDEIARSLADLQIWTRGGSKRVLRSVDLSRADRELLVAAGHLKPIIRGWLMLSRPGEVSANSWHSARMEFYGAYLEDRFGPNWLLSPETSIMCLCGKLDQSMRIVVRAPGANNDLIRLPLKASIFACRAPKPAFVPVKKEGLRIYPPNEALCAISPKYWDQNPTEVTFVLGQITDPTEVIGPLMRGGKTKAAGRLTGAFRSIGRSDLADEIAISMKKAGHDVREVRL